MDEKPILPKIQDADLRDKVVLVRVDHNVVKKGIIHDPYRIDATMATLFHIVAKGGKMILMTHVGRPKDKKTGTINISEDSSVQPVVDYLQNKLSLTLKIPEFSKNESFGYMGIETSINHAIRDLKESKIDGIYLPNTRWFFGEEAKNEAADAFAYQLAGLADVYVNDAFGSWQPHASTVGVTKYLPSYAGLLMQKEINSLEQVLNPERPFVAVVAGAKFDTKIDSLFALLEKADYLVLGGVIYNAYLCAKYGFQINGIDETDLNSAKRFVEHANKYPDKILDLPFIVESDNLESKEEGKYRTHNIHNLPAGTKLNWVLDIDPVSFEERHIRDVFMNAKTIFVNAVMGYTPNFTLGTVAMDELIDLNKAGVKMYGGGDTLQELKKLLPGLYIVALDSPKYCIFTGGGAVLKSIEENSPYGMAPVQALIENKKNIKI
jgi:phosphoglycerate kinase